ncbi:hypothetical protein [Prevotella sp.]
MKKKYFSPAINVYNIVEAEAMLADSSNKPGFKPIIDGFTPGDEEELDGESYPSTVNP